MNYTKSFDQCGECGGPTGKRQHMCDGHWPPALEKFARCHRGVACERCYQLHRCTADASDGAASAGPAAAAATAQPKHVYYLCKH